MTGLNSALLSWQSCSIHAGVDSYPYPFLVVAQDAPTRLPYLLVRRPTSYTPSARTTVYTGPNSDVARPGAAAATPNSP